MPRATSVGRERWSVVAILSESNARRAGRQGSEWRGVGRSRAARNGGAAAGEPAPPMAPDERGEPTHSGRELASSSGRACARPPVNSVASARIFKALVGATRETPADGHLQRPWLRAFANRLPACESHLVTRVKLKCPLEVRPQVTPRGRKGEKQPAVRAGLSTATSTRQSRARAPRTAARPRAALPCERPIVRGAERSTDCSIPIDRRRARRGFGCCCSTPRSPHPTPP